MASKSAILAVRIIGDAKSAISSMKDAEGAAGGFGSKLAGLKPGALAVGGAVVTGVIAAGKALYDLGSTFDEVEDTIRAGTGATGDALSGLVDDAHAVATSVPTDFATAGQTVADLNTRMGLSGDTLQTVASQYLEASRVLGQDVDISGTTAAFQAFGIEGDNVSGAMDALFRVSQSTGVGMNELAGGVQGNALALQELGFSFDQSAALVGTLDKAGVDANGTLNAMRKGMITLAKDGEQPAEAFQRVTGELQGYIATGDTASALDLASTVFGTKGAAQMVQALQSGAISMGDLTATAAGTGDTILGVGQDTMDAAEKWQILKNRGMEALEPLASSVFSFAGDALGGLMEWLDSVDFTPLTGALTTAGTAVSGFGNFFAEAAPKVGGIVSTIRDTLTPVISFLAPIVSNAVTIITGVISGAMTVIQGVVNVIKGIFTGDWSLIWQGAGQIVTGAWDIIKSVVTGAMNHVKAVISAGASILSNLWSGAWTRIKTATSSGVDNTISFVKSLPSRAASALSSAGSALYSAGVALVQGMINGITSKARGIAEAALGGVATAVSKVKGFLGIASPSRLFHEIGAFTGQGLALGITSEAAHVRSAYEDLITPPSPASIDLDAYGNGPKAANTQVTYNINVTGVLDGDDAARKIEKLLRDHARRTGAVTL
jgi:phage-related minor tail protein